MKLTKTEHAYILGAAKKLEAIRILGGSCECGETDFSKLEFHHLSNKSFNISKGKQKRWSEFLAEVLKCQLLCANCHRNRHINVNSKHNQLRKELLRINGTEECSTCGYCGPCLDFHHIDSSNKSFEISDVMIKNCYIKPGHIDYERLILEIAKCKILCANCHKSEHFDHVMFSKFKDEILKRSKIQKEYQRKLSNEMIRNMSDAGLSNSEISRILKCSKSTITNHLRKPI